MNDSRAEPEFGILTLATPKDYMKAIGLALSARVSNPGVPLAVACSPKVRPLVSPYFDHVVDEVPGLRGFVHKVHLDRYSPFRVTFFFDSDVLLFKPLAPIVQRWSAWPYAAHGIYSVTPFSGFGLDRARVAAKIGKPRMVEIDGAGHALFIKPQCAALFDLAREITDRHEEYCGRIPYADEDVVSIALTMLDIPPMQERGFFSRHLSARPGTLKMDATRGFCRFLATSSGQVEEPCMMHFAADEGPMDYHAQLFRLFRKFSVPVAPVLESWVKDFNTFYIRNRLSRWGRRVLGR